MTGLSRFGSTLLGAESYADAAIGLWPPVFAGEQDLGRKLWIDCQPGVFPLSGRFAEIDGFQWMAIAPSRLALAMW